VTALPRLYFDRAVPEGLEGLVVGRAEAVGPEHEALAGADGVIAGASKWTPERIAAAAAGSVKVISRTGIGYDSVDLAAATEHGIVVCNAPEAPTVSTAEHAVALMMAAAKRLADSAELLRSGAVDCFTKNRSVELCGRTLGLVGCGRIARRVGAVAVALQMRVVAADPYLDPSEAPDGVELLGIDDLYAAADVISVHVPATPATRHMFDAAAFAAMRPGVVFVNTARGSLVDQQALLDALDSGQVGAAGLDVTEPEPLPADHRLLSHPAALVTPHIASASDLGRRRLYAHAIDHALDAIAGRRVATCVNPEVYGASSA